MEFDKLAAIVANVLNLDPAEIRPELDFVEDLGADSLDVYQIILGIEEELQMEIAVQEAEGIRTVEEALNLVNSMMN